MPIPRPIKDEKQDTFISRCMSEDTMKKEYGHEQRLGICFSSWKRRKNNIASVDFKVNETEVIDGIKYLKAPVVLLVEGVHIGSNNSGESEAAFYSKDELEKSANMWNEMPVTLNHPKKDGYYVSAKEIENEIIGKLNNTYFESSNSGNKLRSTLYIEKDKLNKENPSLLESIRNNDKIEVSTGLSDLGYYETGIWNNEEYDYVVKNILPDHLAILLDSIGACSWQDGCGVRANIKNKEKDMEKKKKEKLVKNIIDNSAIYTEDNREFLLSLDECPLTKINELVDENKKLDIKLGKVNEKINTEDKKDIKIPEIKDNTAKKEKPLTLNEYIDQAPKEIKEVLLNGIQLHENKKKELITEIRANENNTFEEIDLFSMDISMLEKLSKLAKPKSSYVGREGAPLTNTSTIPTLDIASCFKGRGE